MPDRTVPTLLTPADRRISAAAVLGAATGAPAEVTAAIITAVDAAATAILAVAGPTTDEAAAILVELYTNPGGNT